MSRDVTITSSSETPIHVTTMSGVDLTASVLMPSGTDLVSQLSFISTEQMNGIAVRCSGASGGQVLGSNVNLIVRTGM